MTLRQKPRSAHARRRCLFIFMMEAFVSFSNNSASILHHSVCVGNAVDSGIAGLRPNESSIAMFSFPGCERLLAGQDHLDLFHDFFLAQGIALKGETGEGFIEAVERLFHVREALAVFGRE